MRMFIEWQWLTGDHSAGHSEWAEVWPGTDEPGGLSAPGAGRQRAA